MRKLLQVRHVGVVLHVQAQGQAVALAVLGRIADAVVDGLYDRVDFDGLALHPQFHALRVVGAEDAAHQLGAAGAHQAGNAQNLALADVEVVDVDFAAAVDVARLQHDVADGARVLGVLVLQRAADDHVDELVHRDVLEVDGADVLPVADDRRALADAAELGHAVADVHHADALGLQALDDLKQLVDLALGQGGRRFVQHQDLGVEADGLGDLHHLLLGHAQLAHHRVGVQVNAKVVQNLFGFAVHHRVVDKDAALVRPPDKDVVGHAQMAAHVELLHDDGDAELMRFGDRIDVDFFALDEDLALVGVVYAGQDLHQRRFAGAVLPHKAQDLTFVDIQVHMVQRLDAGEAFADAFHAEQFFRHVQTSSRYRTQRVGGASPGVRCGCGHAAAWPRLRFYYTGPGPLCGIVRFL